MMAGLSPRQIESIQAASGRVNLWDGSIRSGKTIASIIRWLMFVATGPTNGALVMAGRTRDAVWRNVLGPMMDPEITGDAAQFVTGNYGAPTVNILGRRVYVMGAHDVQAEKVLRGLTVAGAYVDEVTTLPEPFFAQLLGRMSVKGAKLFGTTNPDSPQHWLKTRYLNRMADLGGWTYSHFTIDDNTSLDPLYVASIKAEYTGLWYKRFIEGLWVAAEGAIYESWDEDSMTVGPEGTPEIERMLGVGIDYGTSNPTSAVALALTKDKRLLVVDEWRYAASQTTARLTDPELSAHIRSWIETLPMRPQWVFIDPAAASFKTQLFRDGMRNVTDAENAVLYGIRTTAGLIARSNLLVASTCTGLINEFPGYVWDPKATEKGEDRPMKINDHSLDALRYVITTTETLWRGRVTGT